MNKNKVKRISDSISKYMVGFNIDPREDYIGITEWENGEGVDICIGSKLISLHFDELEAINYLIKVMNHEDF